MNKLVLVIAARYSSNIDVLTGFRDLEHAQSTMLKMVNDETCGTRELEDNYAMDTEENHYNITESRDVENRTPEQIEDDKFYTFIFDEADKFYREHWGGLTMPADVKQNFRDNDIRTQDDLSDNEELFDSLEYTAFDEALEFWASIERRDVMERSI